MDEAEVRDLDAVLARLDDQKAEKTSFFEPDDQDPSVRAAKLMLESQSMPVLWRRSIQRSLESTTDLARGRILMTRVMTRLHLCPNLLAFQRTGRPDPSLDDLTHANFPRRPQGHADRLRMGHGRRANVPCSQPEHNLHEAILVWNVHLGGLKRYRGRGLVFFSVAACELLPRLNGADFDDSVLATTDARYIAKWLTLDYPLPRSSRRRPAPAEPTLPCGTGPSGIGSIGRWASSMATVGSFVNNVMLDTILSGPNRLHAIQSLKDGVYWAPKNFSGGDPHVFANQVVLPYLEAKDATS